MKIAIWKIPSHKDICKTYLFWGGRLRIGKLFSDVENIYSIMIQNYYFSFAGCDYFGKSQSGGTHIQIYFWRYHLTFITAKNLIAKNNEFFESFKY